MRPTTAALRLSVFGLLSALALSDARDARGNPSGRAARALTTVTLLDDPFNVGVNQWTSQGCYGGSVGLGVPEEPQQVAANFWQGYFPNWIVAQGCVQLDSRGQTGPGPFEQNWCVNLGGLPYFVLVQPANVVKTGTLELRNALSLVPGTYRITFDLAGPSQAGIYGVDRCVLSLDGLFRETFTKVYGDPWETVTRNVRVCEATSAKLRFSQTGPINREGTNPSNYAYYRYWGCRIDNVKFERVGTGSEPSLTEVQPSSAGNASVVPVRILGVDLPDGQPEAVLRAPGVPDVSVQLEATLCAGELRGTVDLRGAMPGARDLVVSFNGAPAMVAPAAFEVLSGSGPELWVDLHILGNVRVGRPEALTVVCGNRGSDVALGVPVRVTGIPRSAIVAAAAPLMAPPTYGTGAVPAWDALPVTVERSGDQVIALMLPILPPNEVVVVQFLLTATDDVEFRLQATVGRPDILATQGVAKLGAGSARGVTASPPAQSESFIAHYTVAAMVDEDSSYRKTYEEVLGLIVSRVPLLGGVDCVAGLGALLAARLVESGMGLVEEVMMQGYYASVASGGAVLSEQQQGAILASQWNQGAWAAALDDALPLIQATCADAGADLANKLLQDLVADVFRELRLDHLPPAYFNDQVLWTSGERVVRPVRSSDPNAKLGNGCLDAHCYTSGREALLYSILFENVAAATAPAQIVRVEDDLDLALVDPDTFTFLPCGFGTERLSSALGRASFASLIDLRPERDLVVAVNGSFDAATGRVRWQFVALDPATGREPTDPLAGFLPPDITPPEGEGHVMFSVAPRSGLPSGTAIRNKARIFFDYNPAIETPEWVNTIDIAPPASSLVAIPPGVGDTSVRVMWSGQDDASGVRDYSVEVARSGGDFEPWLSHVAQTQSTFVGEIGQSYAFRVQARDQTGNVETKAGADAQVTLVPAPPQEQDGGGALGWEVVLLLGVAGVQGARARRRRREAGSPT